MRSILGSLPSLAGTSQWYSDTAHVHAATHLSGMPALWYDANGNTITRTVAGVTQRLGWDAENRLSAVYANGVTTTFTYDGDGQRVKVNAGGVVTVYVGSTYEINPASGVTTTYYYAGSQRLAMRTAQGVTYLAGDHLGSSSLAMGSSNVSQRYYPYGGTRPNVGTVPTDYQFTGQKLDTGTGLYYYGARYYDPVTGRFISADTIVPGAGNPQSLNRYAYTQNNPVKYTDPTGHMVDCGWNGESHCGVGVGPATPVVTYDTANERGLDNAWAVIGGVVDFLPGLGDAKGLAEVFTGTDLATGEDLGAWRWFGLAGLSELRGVRRLARQGNPKLLGELDALVRSVPSPNGRLGGPKHQAEVALIKAEIGNRGLRVRTEFRVSTPGGSLSARYVDVAALDVAGQPVEFHQVGGIRKDGFPVAREMRAIFDIFSSDEFGGIPITFHPY
jgi:RHS repeat-associated protein